MAHPIIHAKSSAKKFGGIWEDYIHLHNWLDETKAWVGHSNHRMFRHHSEGIFWCEHEFGTYITNSEGRMVPVRAIGEQHCMEDLGWIPTIKNYLDNMEVQGWMFKPGDGRKMLKEMSKDKSDFVKQEKAQLP